jgi:hypothetical protein
MNTEVFWTAMALAFAGLIITPFYLAMYLATLKARAKIDLEFYATANHIQKKVQFDEAVERLFEEGVAE